MDGIEVRRLAPDDDLAAVARVCARSWRHAYRGIDGRRLPEAYYAKAIG